MIRMVAEAKGRRKDKEQEEYRLSVVSLHSRRWRKAVSQKGSSFRPALNLGRRSSRLMETAPSDQRA